MILVTSDVVPGRKIAATCGIVRGSSVRARHLGKDILAFCKNLVGGEISDYTKLLAESREQAIDRMVSQAKQLGANGVIGIRFSTSMVVGGAAELLAYGTGVVATRNAT